MQALSSKVLFEYSHLVARDISTVQAVFYASIPCVRKVSKKACAKLKVLMVKTRVRRGTPTVPRERTARNWLQLVKSSR